MGDIQATHALLACNRPEFQSLYFYRPWMPTQNAGYINYTRVLWSDHSYSYGDSAYQDPPAHAKQKEADGAYKHRKDFLKILNWKPEKFSVASG